MIAVMNGINRILRPGDLWFRSRVASDLFPPEIIDVIPDMVLTQNVLMTPYDTSVHFKYATSYSITSLNTGLSFDTSTGIISGTPTNLGANNPIITASNILGSVDSASFEISVTV